MGICDIGWDIFPKPSDHLLQFIAISTMTESISSMFFLWSMWNGGMITRMSQKNCKMMQERHRNMLESNLKDWGCFCNGWLGRAGCWAMSQKKIARSTNYTCESCLFFFNIQSIHCGRFQNLHCNPILVSLSQSCSAFSSAWKKFFMLDWQFFKMAWPALAYHEHWSDCIAWFASICTISIASKHVYLLYYTNNAYSMKIMN